MAEVVAAVLVGFKLLSRWWVCGWVGGSNGNKANLSPARAGTGLSLAIFSLNFFWSNIFFGLKNVGQKFIEAQKFWVLINFAKSQPLTMPRSAVKVVR